MLGRSLTTCRSKTSGLQGQRVEVRGYAVVLWRIGSLWRYAIALSTAFIVRLRQAFIGLAAAKSSFCRSLFLFGALGVLQADRFTVWFAGHAGSTQAMDRLPVTTPSRMPGVASACRLDVVGAQQQDDQRQRQVNFNAPCKADPAVSAGFEGIVPSGAPAVEPVFDDALLPRARWATLHDSRPALFEGRALMRGRDDAPRKRLGPDQNVSDGFLRYRRFP